MADEKTAKKLSTCTMTDEKTAKKLSTCTMADEKTAQKLITRSMADEKTSRKLNACTMTDEKIAEKSANETKSFRDTSPVALILELLRKDWLLVAQTLMFTVGVMQLSNFTCVTAYQLMTEDRRYYTKVIFNSLEEASNPSRCNPICFQEETRDLNYWTYALCKNNLVTEENCEKLKRLHDYDSGEKFAKTRPALNRKLCVQECYVEMTKPMSSAMKTKLHVILFFWLFVFLVIFMNTCSFFL